MYTAHGWICVRSSREAYSESLSEEVIDELDKETNRADEKLWDELEAHLARYGIPTSGSGPLKY